MLRIKELCKERNIKMKDLATAVGTTPSTLSQSLNGKISLNRLQLIADHLEVSITELFSEIEVEVKIGDRKISYKRK